MIEKMREKELADLTNNNPVDLETLILEGANARIPVTFDYPKPNGEFVELTCCLKPLTSTEVDNARRLALKTRGTTAEIEMLKRGLYTKEGEQFPPELIPKMVSGVVDALVQKLLELSGVKIDEEEQIKFAKEIMGF